MSRLKKALHSGVFVVTSEVGPPKGTDLQGCLQEAEVLRDRVIAINVTDLQSSVMRVGSLAVCARLVERGLEPVFQLTCRDRNRLALQSDLLSAWTLGIKNVLCLTGDHPVLGDHPEAKAVFDLDSVQLLKTVSILNHGRDLAGHELEGAPDFFAGAVVNPGADPLELQLIKMEKKIAAGAQFFQTQAVFEPEKFARFMEKVRAYRVPVLAGIVILKSAGMARYMNKNVAGIGVPEGLIKELEATPKNQIKQKSAEIAARLIRELKEICQGVHIMPLGWADLVPEILEMAGLLEIAGAAK
ncbi:MAG: methylenetetrahydrofolate reductase [Desulfotomaculales bacterium]